MNCLHFGINMFHSLSFAAGTVSHVCIRTQPLSGQSQAVSHSHSLFPSLFLSPCLQRSILCWGAFHVRVLWTYLCRFWEHFILINIIHGLVHSLGLLSSHLPPPPCLGLTHSIANTAELSNCTQHEKFVYCERWKWKEAAAAAAEEDDTRRTSMWRKIARNPSDKCEPTKCLSPSLSLSISLSLSRFAWLSAFLPVNCQSDSLKEKKRNPGHHLLRPAWSTPPRNILLYLPLPLPPSPSHTLLVLGPGQFLGFDLMLRVIYHSPDGAATTELNRTGL